MKRVLLYKPPPLKDLGGRPTKCTPELTEEFCHYIKRMLPAERVNGLLGISNTSYYQWNRLGLDYEQAMEEGNKPIASHRVFYKFMQSVNRAKAQYMLHVIDRSFASDKASMHWQRDMTLLERRDRVNWGRYEKIEVEEVDYDPNEAFL